MLKFKNCLIGFLFLLLFSSIANADFFSEIQEKYLYTNKHLNLFTLKKHQDLFLSDDKKDKNFSYEAKKIFQLAVTDMSRYSNGSHTKIVMKFDSRSADQISEYYYYHGKLYFVCKTVIEYMQNKDEDNFIASDKKILINRFYFNNEKMLQWINNKNEKINSKSKEYKIKENEILSDAKNYYNL